MDSSVQDLELRDITIENYERVIEVVHKESGLCGIIAIHNTRLGPALGGTRAYPYKTFEHALEDALRLARGMTYKAAVAKTGTGGGKSVLFVDHKKPKSEKLLLAFAEAVNSLQGNYICAEDIGMQPTELAVVRKGTRYAVGLPHPNSSGDPSYFTAWGGYQGILAACKHLWGSSSVSGKTVAIQGLGAVGMKLAETLFWHGARIVVTDIDTQRVQEAMKRFRAEAVTSEEIYRVPCDIFAPCALGGILNSVTIPALRCKAVAGLANNQLLTEEDGKRLFARQILYAPDYVINSGGLLNVCVELQPKGYDPRIGRDHVNGLYEVLSSIFEKADCEKKPTDEIANAIAEYNLENLIGKRSQPVVFHH